MTCTIMYSDIPKIFYQVGSKQVWGQSSGCVAVRFQFFGGCWSECQWEEHLPGGHWCGGSWAGHSEGGVEEASWWLALVPVEFQTPCWTNRSFFLWMPTHWNLIVFSPSWQISSVLGSFLLLESFQCLVVLFRRHDSFNMIDHTSLVMMLSEGPFMLESYYVQTELPFWYGGIPSVAGVSCHQLWFAAQHRLLCSPNWSPTELMPGQCQLWTWSKCRIAF